MLMKESVSEKFLYSLNVTATWSLQTLEIRYEEATDITANINVS
jgi:hypothetical protein